MWKLQLQTWISLRSTDSEYIALTQALCKIIYIIDIIKKMEALGYDVGTDSPNLLYKLFEDNSGALTLACDTVISPRTKHINVKYHPFCAYVANSIIATFTIESYKQPVDMITHALNEYVFIRHRRSIMGW